ncbi:Holliday junction resolvase RuvX [Nitrococcus mobilis]|uniref:Putative pre-16S rRNA nuclease n=1 Tax=Nitrococcus mobilis Nb-231 TaxID=314278 RepID=A4BSB3_9GAMM|nr:Holliday junction resolvase RuvX [Nitrococcus mobilis]EAR21373.1 Holliday junction resolvase YqgF [Nitrococcus mobilis Nb-231]
MSTQIYLGFDYGWRRLGVAVGQPLTGGARPVTTLRCRQGQPDWAALLHLIEAWQPTALVVGIPRHTDGSASETTLQAVAFAQRLEQRGGLPVHQVDERLSSHEARARLQATGRRLRGTTGKALVDQFAAQIILETWLNEQRLL